MTCMAFLVLQPRQTVNPTVMSPQTLCNRWQKFGVWYCHILFLSAFFFSPSLLCFCARPQVCQCTLPFFSCCISAETEGQTCNVSTWPGLSTVIGVFRLAFRNDLIMMTARYLHLLLKTLWKSLDNWAKPTKPFKITKRQTILCALCADRVINSSVSSLARIQAGLPQLTLRKKAYIIWNLKCNHHREGRRLV